MTFEYESKIYLGEVALYVADLARQRDFYQRVLGLELLEEQDGEVTLGRDGQVLVRLLATSDRQSVKSAYGLYHLALLLPSRQALADILKHLSENKVPMVGGADHEDQSGVRSETWRRCLRFCPAKWRRMAPLRNRRWRQTGNPAYR